MEGVTRPIARPTDQSTAQPAAQLAYCTNVHAGDTLARTRAMLDQHAVRVRSLFAPDSELGIGLWLSAQAARSTGVPVNECRHYFDGLDWRLGLKDLDGLTEFFRRLELAGRVPRGKLAFLPAAKGGR